MSRPSSPPRITQRSLFFWALQGNLKIQLLLLCLIVGMVFFRVLPLEMQKRIINDAISLGDFESLLLYCGIYLVAVTATAAMKLGANYLQAKIAERAMLAMRKELYAHIIGLPLQFFRSTQPGMVVASLMTELNTAANFAGMAMAVPISNILTLLAFAGYLVWLNPKLAPVTLAIYPVVAFLIPYVQKKVNRLNKQRVDKSRLLSSQIAESITGVTEINVHGAYSQEKNKFNRIAETLRDIRVRWTLLRFGIKTVNNYFASLGPFVVFLFGGYLVMEGQLELGSLVAFLSAQEKLYDPWKELIEYYQVYEDAMVRYYRTMQYFDIASEHNEEISYEAVPELAGRLEVSDLSYVTANGTTLVKGVSFSLKAGEHMALVGFSGSGKSTLVHCIAKMFDYSDGSILLDGQEIKEMAKSELIQHVGYISQQPFIFSGTLRENLLYAHRAAASRASAGEEYQPPALDYLILALQQAGIFVDVIRFGLNSFLHSSETEMITKVIRIRKQFRKEYGESLQEHIEFYQERQYLYHADVAENIVFGSPLGGEFQLSSLGANPSFKRFLETMGLAESLLDLGANRVREALEGPSDGVLGDGVMPPQVSPEWQERYRGILIRLRENLPRQLSEEDQASLLTLALQFVPGHPDVALVERGFWEKVLRCRVAWRGWSEKELSETFNYFEEDQYIFGESIFNNILLGRMKTEESRTHEHINQNIIRLLIEEDCLESLAEAGMEYHLGSMGNLLSGGQKQKLAIARVLLKDPKVILMDESTSALDNKSQTRIQHLIEQHWRKRRTVIAVVHRLDSIEGFDKIAVMKDGKIVEFGTYPELIAQKGLLAELVFGNE